VGQKTRKDGKGTSDEYVMTHFIIHVY